MIYLVIMIVWLLCGLIALPFGRKMTIERYGFLPSGELVYLFILGPVSLLAVTLSAWIDWINNNNEH